MQADHGERRFACTQCGSCCDRSPEVTLGEAAGLADVFVFRLLVRLVAIPARAGERRHVADFAAGRAPKREVGGASAYVILSALSVDRGGGRCSALRGSLCSIHERRPLSCRSVPLHYSRSDRRLLEAIDSFTAKDHHHCATGAEAPLLLSGGKVVDAGVAAARLAGRLRSAEERRWEKAIFAKMAEGAGGELPTFGELAAAADRGALTTSMEVAWRIAVAEGLMSMAEYGAALASQIEVMDRLLSLPSLSLQDRQTLIEMRRDYALRQGSELRSLNFRLPTALTGSG